MTEQNHTGDGAQSVGMREALKSAQVAIEATLEMHGPDHAGLLLGSINKIDRALAAYTPCMDAAQPPAAPVDGWQLVPIEPTPEMLNSDEVDAGERTMRKAWRGMLANAPKPPAVPVDMIDSVPSCGQENDYRRASPAVSVETRKELHFSEQSWSHEEREARAPAAPVEAATAPEMWSRLVDWTYLHATEGEAWPSTKTKESLIARAIKDKPTQDHADGMKAMAPLSRSSAATEPLMDAGSIFTYLRERMADETSDSLAIACRALADHLRVLRDVPQEVPLKVIAEAIKTDLLHSGNHGCRIPASIAYDNFNLQGHVNLMSLARAISSALSRPDRQGDAS